MKIKDYLHLYIGCEVRCCRGKGAKGILKGINTGDLSINPVQILTGSILCYLRFSEVMPILRPLESLSEEEDQEFALINRDWIDGHWSADGLLWLLKNQFDLFGLIKAGLAIDKTKQTVNHS